ncbi:hypothetical protein [Methanobrevibacter sp.]|uniref:hypothetical protein n=1 Tax=Methanobrevibacter sp. TaxID=66852 RepID=UPI002E7A1FEC|nr:hypothetical protein [Methanobrevibacter sp.]MEE0938764.1 hypothetical protein [Methanobrevibacter sp.]
MLKIKHHFLDTNMILTIPLKNDNFRECAEYYKLDYERHMSNHVEKEVFSVIERLRLISLDIFKHIKDYIISNNIPLIKIDSHIHKIKTIYLNRFKRDDYAFGIEKDRFVDIVNDVFIIYYDEIKDTIVDNDVNLNSLSSKLRNLFKMYNKTITICIANFDKFSYANNQKLIDQLIDIGIHKSDAIIVDDCYNKSKDMNEKFVFITYDNKIMECSGDAFKLLNSKVHFSKPASFLNN